MDVKVFAALMVVFRDLGLNILRLGHWHTLKLYGLTDSCPGKFLELIRLSILN
jgi:hypothetical protein